MSTVDPSKGVVKIVFLALILDLLAFTLPLPLFPRLIDWYTTSESSNPDTLLARSLSLFRSLRRALVSPKSGAGWADTDGGNQKWDVVLLGGAMGSVFSLCQCVISPYLGALSDKYGRRNVLLATMVGNIISVLLWLQSTSFSSFLLSRLVGGLSEGNVQLSTAIISDVTTSTNRSKSLALIGIAFSICFTFGPSLGAYFASRPPPTPSSSTPTLNIYAYPALISLLFLVTETAYLFFALPETRGMKKLTLTGESGKVVEKGKKVRESVQERRKRLKMLGRMHGSFLLLFSGAEYTLTFLTYDLFSATNKQNGLLLSYIGILSSLLQGGHVRPSLSKGKTSELTFARRGMITCGISLLLMSLLPLPSIRSSAYAQPILYTIATGLSYTSATCVTGLMSAAADCCDDDDEDAGKGEEKLPRGRSLGGFRSAGQAGRAVGPMLVTASYWSAGPTAVYGALVPLMGLLAMSISPMVGAEVKRKMREQKTQ